MIPNFRLPLQNNDVDMADPSATGPGGSIILNATAEFCRTLGDIPTYGQAGNREEEAQELLVSSVRNRLCLKFEID